MLDDNEYFDDQNHFRTLLGNDGVINSTNSVRDNLANYLWNKKIQRNNKTEKPYCKRFQKFIREEAECK